MARFADRSRLDLVADEDAADAVVRATVTGYSVAPAAVTGTNLAQLSRVTVAVRVVVAGPRREPRPAGPHVHGQRGLRAGRGPPGRGGGGHARPRAGRPRRVHGRDVGLVASARARGSARLAAPGRRTLPDRARRPCRPSRQRGTPRPLPPVRPALQPATSRPRAARRRPARRRGRRRWRACRAATPTYAAAHVLLAVALDAAGDPAEALAAWHRAAFLVPRSPLVRRERQRLTVEARIAAARGTLAGPATPGAEALADDHLRPSRPRPSRPRRHLPEAATTEKARSTTARRDAEDVSEAGTRRLSTTSRCPRIAR